MADRTTVSAASTAASGTANAVAPPHAPATPAVQGAPLAPTLPQAAAAAAAPRDKLLVGLAQLKVAKQNGTLPEVLAKARAGAGAMSAASSNGASGAGAGAGAGASAVDPTARVGTSEVCATVAEAKAAATVDVTEAELTRPSPMSEAHPFLHYYGMLTHQANMLQDNIRTTTYRSAMMKNAADFRDAVVLDVGTGTGILAYFAVQAGAKRVYAVEASSMAHHARRLMKANGLEDKVIVLEGRVEEVDIPEKVDIIISEPIGFVLVHERMLECYVAARERFLKKGGLMMPTTGTIFAAPFTDADLYQETVDKSAFWKTTDMYGLDVSCLEPYANTDNFAQPVVGYFNPSVLLTEETATAQFNFTSCTLGELQKFEIPFRFEIGKTALLHGIACWFDCTFDGSSASVKLDTAPQAPGTHWYQARLLLKEPLAVNRTQSISGSLVFVANKHYSYYVTMTVKLDGTRIQATNVLNMHDQYYHYLSNTEAATSASGHAHGQQSYSDYATSS